MKYYMAVKNYIKIDFKVNLIWVKDLFQRN